MSAVKTLRGVALFAGLSDRELRAIEAILGWRTFGKGVYIFHKGSPGQVMYLIESGRVRIFVVSDMGQEISIQVYGPGEPFGEMALLDGETRSAGAVCLETTTTRTLHRDDLDHLLETHPRLAKNLLKILCGRLRHTAAYAEELAFLDVNSRLATRLLDMADRSGAQASEFETDLCLTQAELASWVAARRESVNKALRTFRGQGLIEMNEGKIEVLDRRGLERQIHY